MSLLIYSNDYSRVSFVSLTQSRLTTQKPFLQFNLFSRPIAIAKLQIFSQFFSSPLPNDLAARATKILCKITHRVRGGHSSLRLLFLLNGLSLWSSIMCINLNNKRTLVGDCWFSSIAQSTNQRRFKRGQREEKTYRGQNDCAQSTHSAIWRNSNSDFFFFE